MMTASLHAVLRDACAKVGIIYREVPADGRWHETDVEDDGKGRGDGRIKLFADGEGGIVWNWKGAQRVFFADDGRKLLITEAERRERDRRRAEAIREAEEEEARRHAKAAKEAAAIWKEARPAQEDHPYLVRKNVKPVQSLREIQADRAAKILGYWPQAKGEPLVGRLVVAPVKVGDKLSTAELIDEAGRKSAVYGGAKAGGYWAAQPLPEGDGAGLVLIIGEGVATVLTGCETTGHHVIAALSAGNLPEVAKAMHQRYPAAVHVILADLVKATGEPDPHSIEAAQAVGGLMAVPDFGADRPEDATDFNDLHRLRGLEAVERAIRDATPPTIPQAQPREKNATAGDYEGPAWGDPIPFDEIDTPDIPARLLPGILGEFAGALATATETPEAMAVMTVLGVVAAAVAKRFRISPIGGWHESVNIYALVALPPGNNKSTVFNACTVPLVEWEKEQAMIHEPQAKRQKSERRSQEKIIEAKRGALAKENDAAQQKALMRDIADMEAQLSEPHALPQLFANDTTPESLATNVHEQGGRFAVFSDEGGITETMSGLYTGGQANVDILLKGIDGGHVRVRRKDRNFDLNPFLTVVLTVQPIIIQRMGEKKAFAGKGLLERFLWVLPKSKLGYRTHDKPPVSEGVKEAYRRTIRALLDIPPLMEEGTERARILTLESVALAEWRAFQAAIEVQLRPDARLAICQGWGGKISGFALRLAGLLHVAEHGQDKLTISADTMGRALELAALLTEHALSAYGLMGLDQATTDAKDCWRWIQAQGRPSFTNGELSLAMRHRMHKERIDRALRVLHDQELVSQPERIPGKKTLLYRVHPQFIAGGE